MMTSKKGNPKLVRYVMISKSDEPDLSAFASLFTNPIEKENAQKLLLELKTLENKIFRIDDDGRVELVTDKDSVFSKTSTNFADFLTWLINASKPRPREILLFVLTAMNNLPPHAERYLI